MFSNFMFSSKHRRRLSEATRRLAVAEVELTAAMAELDRYDRADKHMVGDRLRAALTELVTARHRLAETAP